MNNNKISIRKWISFILIGLTGQLAWAIENMYLNKFIFYLDNSGSYMTLISITVALSAITACLTTLFIGALSDKINKRKIFIAVGCILWGLSTASFGLINTNNIHQAFPLINAGMMAGILVIILDCVMTFFGSSANDASFNSYVTREVNKENRGKVEGVLSILPLVAMLIIFVGLNSLTDNGKWDIFFYIIGGFVFIVGIISFFLLPKESNKKKEESYLRFIKDGFSIKTIKENKILYITFIAFMIYGISTQVFFPYLIIYFQYSLGFSGLDFMLALGLILVIGSILSVIYGILIDKFNKYIMIIPITIIFMIGLFLLIFVNKGNLVFAIISGIIMMSGYISLGTNLNSIVRDLIPSNKEGSFMGIRMIFVVMIPMCTGPFIGEAISKAFPFGTYEDLGVVKALPSNKIWLFSLLILLLIFIPIIFIINLNNKNKDNKNKGLLYKDIDINIDDIPLKEYPRKTLVRDSYLSLNGKWDIAIRKDKILDYNFNNKEVIVPYAIETNASKVNHLLEIDEYIHYHKLVTLPKNFNKGKVIINFEGIDQISEIYINNIFIEKHIGGYDRFSIDVTPFINNLNQFDLYIIVSDSTSESSLTKGKQALSRGGIWYTSSSGIYKPIWIESIPINYIKDIKINPLYDKKGVSILVKTNIDDYAYIKFLSYYYKIPTNKEYIIENLDLPTWDIDNPNLIDVEVKFYNDLVHTYFGFRKIEIKGSNIYLNNKKIFINGLLDQGYYYGSGLTPLSYEDYLSDILNIKHLGFNTLRVHIKEELDLFYYYCDLNGILVIQDIPNGGSKYKNYTMIRGGLLPFLKKKNDHNYKAFSREDKESRVEYVKILNNILSNLNNHPSVIIYTLFNEGWGQFDSKTIYEYAKSIDKNRIYDVCSGWYDNGFNEIYSIHSYFYPLKIYKKLDKPFLFTEFGGYSLKLNDHFYGNKDFGYKKFNSINKLTLAYEKLFKKKIIPLIDKGLGGVIYTQLNDVEDEVNGLYTFDRKILKVKQDKIIEINDLINKKY